MLLNKFSNIVLNVKDIVEAVGFIISVYFSIKVLIQRNKQKLIINSIKELYKIVENNPTYEWLISEKFYIITNLRINSSDIKDLIQDTNAIKIIYLLNKYKRVYDYKNQKLIIINEFNNKNIKMLDNIFIFLSSIIFGGFFILSSLIFALSDTMQDKIIFGIYIIISSIYLTIFLTWKDDKILEKELLEITKDITKHRSQ